MNRAIMNVALRCLTNPFQASREAIECEINEELAFHIEQKAADLMAEGMTAREARQAAEQAFGSRDSILQQCRRIRMQRTTLLTKLLTAALLLGAVCIVWLSLVLVSVLNQNADLSTKLNSAVASWQEANAKINGLNPGNGSNFNGQRLESDTQANANALMSMIHKLFTQEPNTRNRAKRDDRTFQNGNLEKWEGDLLADWLFNPNPNVRLNRETQNISEGTAAVRLDTTGFENAEQASTMITQLIDAATVRGQKVRFRAMIKTADMRSSAFVQMIMRVDGRAGHGGQPPTLLYDNTSGQEFRPADWQALEMVVPVPEKGETILLGVVLSGQGIAWLDDISFAVVTDDTPTTVSPARFAEIDAANAEPQAFFTHWLWLPIMGIILFCIAMLGGLPQTQTRNEYSPPIESPSKLVGRVFHLLERFATRFAVVYWIVYFLGNFGGWHSRISTWLAHNLFSLSSEPLPPTGSGDTTHHYLAVLGCFLVSLIMALVWSMIDRRSTDHAALRDLLRSGLRYALAGVMLSYGLAKLHFSEMNQFWMHDAQLAKVWGSSSPMNVLWGFMGTSLPYTMFAGLAEVVVAGFLLFRRTALLGALIGLGVTMHIMLLNYCYDIPVKILSTHLAVMSIMIILPDARRLFNLFVLNRSVPAACLTGIWQPRWAWWTRMSLKTVIIILVFLMPLSRHVVQLPAQWEKYSQMPVDKTHLLKSRGYHWINEVPFNR